MVQVKLASSVLVWIVFMAGGGVKTGVSCALLGVGGQLVAFIFEIS